MAARIQGRRVKRRQVKRRLDKIGIDLAAHVDRHQALGKTPEQIAFDVVDDIAAVTPWSALGPVGVLVDAVEAAAVKAIIHAIALGLAKKPRPSRSP